MLSLYLKYKNILSLIKAPSRKKFSFSDLCIFHLLSSTKSVPMHLITCWIHKQSDIFISSYRNEPSQLQNYRTKRFFTVFGTLRITWRQRKEILSPLPPLDRVCFVSFLEVRTFHSVWYVRHCTASTVVPKYGPHLIGLLHHKLINGLHMPFLRILMPYSNSIA